MRRYLLAAAALAAIATPAAARDGSPYVGIEAGLLFPKDGDIEVEQPGEDFDTNRSIDFNRGRDIDIIGGYDFGAFRIEGELAFKRTRADEVEFEDAEEGTIRELGNPRVRVRSIMANALLDFGDPEGIGFYAGAGIGRARGKAEGDRDSAFAFQGIAGVRAAVSPNIDLGLKYRFFRTGQLRFNQDFDFGDGQTFPVGIDTRFRSHSLLASLIFNFGAAEVLAPPPPPPPPPPPAVIEAPPATQTCPDGTVVLATEVCPPPPPPPPPPAQGERG